MAETEIQDKELDRCPRCGSLSTDTVRIAGVYKVFCYDCQQTTFY